MKRIAKKIHLWIGVFSGIIIIILGISGCFYAYKSDLEKLIYPKKYYLDSIGRTKIPITQLKTKLERDYNLKGKLTRIIVHRSDSMPYSFIASEIDKKACHYWAYQKMYYGFYVNPYTAEVVCIEDKNDFFKLVLAVHRRLLLGERIGTNVVGICTVLFFINLIIGVFIWLPRRFKLKFIIKKLKFNKFLKFNRFVYELHTIMGVVFLVPLLIISLTGIVWFGKGFVKKIPPKDSKTIIEIKEKSNIYEDLITYSTRNYDYKKLRFSLPKQGKSTSQLMIYPNSFTLYDFTKLNIDISSGKITKFQVYKDKSVVDKLLGMNYDLHTNLLLSRFGQFLVFVSGLIALVLVVSGFCFSTFFKERNN